VRADEEVRAEEEEKGRTAVRVVGPGRMVWYP